MEEELYYIRNNGYVGNSLIWWGKGGKGYTCDLNKAWRVTREEAESICRNRPDEDSMYRVADMDAIAQRHVDMQDLPLNPSRESAAT